ncbi:GIY-YIG nuclease family protein [uncultured Brevundimonas sp.]|uniref:GIY-YIG nuclease family protein n=1 Tax=uncultured Brevundimonas sp. TaxID=213418 RepID=UPI00260B3233|nr:GIY-YIG nuclease family protein [uncultured Brevundimonas sp.]
MTSAVNGRSLELYFIDGRPDGMLTAEVFNWTGHVLVTPRTRLKEALARQEAKYTGVYILLGERDEVPLAYIGEAEDLASRIKNHETGDKDWWTSAILVTSAANNLHKAHAKYLESRLVEEAKKVGTMPLNNGNTPPRPSLSEAARANMEAFLDYLFMVLPAVRIDMFVQKVRPTGAVSAEAFEPSSGRTEVGSAEAIPFYLESAKHKLRADAFLIDGEFVVQAGSMAQGKEDVVSGIGSYTNLIRDLVSTGVLQRQGEHYVFSQSYAFRSPSAAGAVVLGYNVNGTTAWKTASGQTYKEWEATELRS